MSLFLSRKIHNEAARSYHVCWCPNNASCLHISKRYIMKMVMKYNVSFDWPHEGLMLIVSFFRGVTPGLEIHNQAARPISCLLMTWKRQYVGGTFWNITFGRCDDNNDIDDGWWWYVDTDDYYSDTIDDWWWWLYCWWKSLGMINDDVDDNGDYHGSEYHSSDIDYFGDNDESGWWWYSLWRQSLEWLRLVRGMMMGGGGFDTFPWNMDLCYLNVIFAPRVPRCVSVEARRKNPHQYEQYLQKQRTKPKQRRRDALRN